MIPKVYLRAAGDKRIELTEDNDARGRRTRTHEHLTNRALALADVL